MSERIRLEDYRNTVALRVLTQRANISRLQLFIDRLNYMVGRDPLPSSIDDWKAFNEAYGKDDVSQLWVLRDDAPSGALRNFYNKLFGVTLTDSQFTNVIAGSLVTHISLIDDVPTNPLRPGDQYNTFAFAVITDEVSRSQTFGARASGFSTNTLGDGLRDTAATLGIGIRRFADINDPAVQQFGAFLAGRDQSNSLNSSDFSLSGAITVALEGIYGGHVFDLSVGFDGAGTGFGRFATDILAGTREEQDRRVNFRYGGISYVSDGTFESSATEVLLPRNFFDTLLSYTPGLVSAVQGVNFHSALDAVVGLASQQGARIAGNTADREFFNRYANSTLQEIGRNILPTVASALFDSDGTTGFGGFRRDPITVTINQSILAGNRGGEEGKFIIRDGRTGVVLIEVDLASSPQLDSGRGLTLEITPYGFKEGSVDGWRIIVTDEGDARTQYALRVEYSGDPAHPFGNNSITSTLGTRFDWRPNPSAPQKMNFFYFNFNPDDAPRFQYAAYNSPNLGVQRIQFLDVYVASAPNRESTVLADGTPELTVTLNLVSLDGRNWYRQGSSARASPPPEDWSITQVNAVYSNGRLLAEKSEVIRPGAAGSNGGVRITAEKAGALGAALLASGDERGNFWQRVGDYLEDYADSPRPITFSQFGSAFGSNLSRLIDIDDPFAALAVGTTIGTIGLNLGQLADRALDIGQTISPSVAFKDFPKDLASAGIGAISSFLLGELLSLIDLPQGFEGAVTSLAGAAIGQIGENIVRGAKDIFSGFNPALFLNAAGSFLGGFIASKLVTPYNQAEAIAGALGGAIGGIIGSLIPVPFLGSLVGSFIGQLAGTGLVRAWNVDPRLLLINAAAIGAVGAAPLTFGISLVATAVITAVVGLILAKPRAAAGVDWDGAAERFTLGDIVARHGGNWREARSLAEQAIAGLNGVLDTVGGRLLNGAEVETGSYGRYKREYVYRLTDSVDRRARDVVFRTDDAQELVDFGVFRSLSAFAAPVAEPCGARH